MALAKGDKVLFLRLSIVRVTVRFGPFRELFRAQKGRIRGFKRRSSLQTWADYILPHLPPDTTPEAGSAFYKKRQSLYDKDRSLPRTFIDMNGDKQSFRPASWGKLQLALPPTAQCQNLTCASQMQSHQNIMK
jgi:hypothetical protein